LLQPWQKIPCSLERIATNGKHSDHAVPVRVQAEGCRMKIGPNRKSRLKTIEDEAVAGSFSAVLTRKPPPINSSTVSVAPGRRSALRCARFLAASLHGTSGQRIQVLTDVP
jgi:hypothetical protein